MQNGLEELARAWSLRAGGIAGGVSVAQDAMMTLLVDAHIAGSSHFGTQFLMPLRLALTKHKKMSPGLVATLLLSHHMQREQTQNIA
ncbi:MAG: hypothetical protein Rhims3KO_13400 [Hyphomicrobiales bacterium]